MSVQAMGLENLLDRPIAFHRCFVTLTGSVPAALMLSQAIYWSRRTRKDGWFYKSQKEWEEETGLTRREQDTARRSLKVTGFWEEDLRRVPATMHFRVNVEKLLSSLALSAKLVGPNPPNLYGGKRQALLLPETTAETTSKNLRPLSRPSPPACGNLRPDESGKSQKRWVRKGKGQNETTATPQQRRFAIVGRLAKAAVEILNRKPDYPLGDLAEELKQWAANEDIPYFDARAGAATPIQQAITIALERRTPL